jgi:hypothetical protein
VLSVIRAKERMWSFMGKGFVVLLLLFLFLSAQGKGMKRKRKIDYWAETQRAR